MYPFCAKLKKIKKIKDKRGPYGPDYCHTVPVTV